MKKNTTDTVINKFTFKQKWALFVSFLQIAFKVWTDIKYPFMVFQDHILAEKIRYMNQFIPDIEQVSHKDQTSSEKKQLLI